jgi:phospholipid-binding lipoprotein MlaA
MKRLPLRRWLALLWLPLASACASEGGPDPWRGYNERMFAFNDAADRWVVGPVARGWKWTLPDFAMTGIDNFFDNLRVPRTFLNDVLQAKPVKASEDLWRFILNTSVGVAGLFDVASELGLPHNEEDFGQTFGWWGTPSGPYLQLPIYEGGPRTLRDTLVLPLDLASDPTFWAGILVEGVFGLGVIEAVNARARNDEQIEENRREAIDWYVFVRDAYLQHREAAVRDGEEPAPEEEEDLYELDEELAGGE